MQKTLLAVATALLVQTAPAVAQKAEIMGVINQFIDGFNKGDIASALATCAEQTSIIDEIAPYAWHGAGACSTWANDYDADAKRRGVTDGVVTLSAAKHLNVTGDRAYGVFPASYEYKEKGKPVKQTNSTMTVALQKGAPGWRIIAWSWATN